MRYFCHTKDFRTDFKNPLIESYEKYRTVHTSKRIKNFEWRRFKSTRDVRWCVFKDRSSYFPFAETVVPRSAVLYNKNLLEDVSGTYMKYSAVDIYVGKIVHNSQRLNKPWCIDWYFNSYREKPYLEQRLKVGGMTDEWASTFAWFVARGN